jgi:hypothetical protein
VPASAGTPRRLGTLQDSYGCGAVARLRALVRARAGRAASRAAGWLCIPSCARARRPPRPFMARAFAPPSVSPLDCAHAFVDAARLSLSSLVGGRGGGRGSSRSLAARVASVARRSRTSRTAPHFSYTCTVARPHSQQLQRRPRRARPPLSRPQRRARKLRRSSCGPTRAPARRARARRDKSSYFRSRSRRRLHKRGRGAAEAADAPAASSLVRMPPCTRRCSSRSRRTRACASARVASAIHAASARAASDVRLASAARLARSGLSPLHAPRPRAQPPCRRAPRAA